MRPSLPWMALPALLGLFALALALAAAPAADARPDGPAAPPIVELSVSLTFSPDTANATVTNTLEGVAVLNGNVSVGKLGTSMQRVTVTMEATPIQGWELVISPSTMVFIAQYPQEFALSVRVPAKTLVSSKAVEVTATATDGIQTATASTTATVSVRQFFQLSVVTEGGAALVKAGETALFDITIINEGNGKDTFMMDIVDEQHVLDGFDLPKSVEVPPGQSATVSVSARTREDFDTGAHGSADVVLVITSAGAEQRGDVLDQQFTLTITFKTLAYELEKNWPSYVGLGIALAAVVVVVAVVVRRIRRRRHLDREALVAIQDGERGQS